MKAFSPQKFILFFSFLLSLVTGSAQINTPGDTLVVAGKEYDRSGLHQWLWGKHYRREWATPVKHPLLWLDTVNGGLKPYEAGGGRQSKSLRLHNPQQKEYVLRSINKSFGKALPPVFQNTWIESVINDQVSIAHPYSSVTIPPMAEAAGIYHSKPIIRYLPKQPGLNNFNQSFGDDLYLLEQRADEDWREASNFGNAEKIISTEKLLQNMQEDNRHLVDQPALIKARLFDMLIGDWGRHEDQWRWGRFKQDDKFIYRAIPRDRDQAFTKFDGALLGLFLSAASLGHLQTFEGRIKDVRSFNFPSRNLDRHLLNETSLEQWTTAAKEIQAAITDEIIDKAMLQLPPEVYPVSGKEIAGKLKQRKNDLVKYAADYYLFLAKEVEVTGSKQNEFFLIERLPNEETSVKIFRQQENMTPELLPYYQRIFKSSETGAIRLYGINGQDSFLITGSAPEPIRVSIIGGPGRDAIIDQSVTGKKRLHIYDNFENKIEGAKTTKLHLSNDTSIHHYEYAGFTYDKKGIKPIVFYNNDDRLFVGLGYGITKQQWRKEPFGYKHGVYARYSIIQKGFNFFYKGEVNQFIGKWNLGLDAGYDFVRWTNFFGTGNESQETTNDRDFYRLRTELGQAQIGLNRYIGKRHKIDLTGFYQRVQIINDPERFVAKRYNGTQDLLTAKNFGGARFTYSLEKLNNEAVPTKGLEILTTASFTGNLNETNKTVQHYTGAINLYLQLVRNLVLAVRTGGATLSGEPEFYQLNSIGGSNTLRGYRRDRFWGESAFYNSNELQWLFNVRTHLFNGKLGLIGLYDQGRVWMKQEDSNTLHSAYGGGFLIAPFNKAMLSLTYGISKENGILHFRYHVPLR